MQKAINLIDELGEINEAIEKAFSIKKKLEANINELKQHGATKDQLRQTRKDKYSTLLYLWRLIKCKREKKKKDKQQEAKN